VIRVELNSEQREELRRRTRKRGIDPRTRDRLEMVRLSDAGWSVPRIARHLGYHEQTVRKYIKAFIAGGFDRLPDKPHLGRRPKVTEEMLAALERLIDESDRTWTTPQLARWLEDEYQVRVHPDHLARLLHRRGFNWKRTKRSVAHKQKDPLLQAAKAAELEVLKKSGPGG
jgi:putative transposase